MIAEGLERRPLRAGMSAASGVYHAAGLKNMLGRMGGGAQGGGEDPGGGAGGPDGGGGGGRRNRQSQARSKAKDTASFRRVNASSSSNSTKRLCESDLGGIAKLC